MASNEDFWRVVDPADVVGRVFDRPDPETTVVDPLARQKTSAADYLEGLLSQSAPRQGVAGMTGIEQFGQQALGDYVRSGMPAGFGSSMDYFNRIVNQPTDITQFPEYQAILKSIGVETSEAVNRANRGIQMQGLGTSTPQGKAVGKEISRGGDRMLAALGPYAEGERGRQMNAASMLAELAKLSEVMKQGRLGAIQQFGGLPRQLDQANLSSLFNQQMVPFTTQADVASRIFGGDVDYTHTQEPSLMDQVSGLIGGILGAKAKSDKRSKEHIEDLGYASRKVKKIKAKVYNYKGTDPMDRRVGFLAQDVEKVLPEAVSEFNGVKYVDYNAVLALATDAVNELFREVEKLKRKKVA